MASPNTTSDDRQGHFLVATSDLVAYIRVVGLGTMNNTISLKQFLEHLQERGFHRFVFDLSECSGFDSTFMGILLGLALGQISVVVVNANRAQKKLLSEVGIHRVIRLCEDRMPPPDVTLKRLEFSPVDHRTRTRTMLEAHENLVSLDEKNRQKFGVFLDLLRGELGETSP
jgi:hypothetical protein